MTSWTALRETSSDHGFTLVELLVAVAILGVISVPLSNAVMAYLRNADATTARLMESHDAQIASAYWAQDVASIGTRNTTSPYALNQSVWTGVSSGLYSCATTGTAIVTLAWDEFSGTGTATTVQVVYVQQTVSGQTQLHRLRCNGTTTVASDVTLAHNLDPSPSTPPTVACKGTSGPDCAAAPAVPRTVTLTLNLKNAGNRGTAYALLLTGQRRQS